MHDARYLRTQSVKAEAVRDQTVSELDPIFGIIEEDRLAEQALDEEAGEKDVTKLELMQDQACMRWQRARGDSAADAWGVCEAPAKQTAQVQKAQIALVAWLNAFIAWIQSVVMF